jgi:hypothetical protein
MDRDRLKPSTQILLQQNLGVKVCEAPGSKNQLAYFCNQAKIESFSDRLTFTSLTKRIEKPFGFLDHIPATTTRKVIKSRL